MLVSQNTRSGILYCVFLYYPNHIIHAHICEYGVVLLLSWHKCIHRAMLLMLVEGITYSSLDMKEEPEAPV